MSSIQDRALPGGQTQGFFQAITTRGPRLWQRFWSRSNERIGYLFILPSLVHTIIFLAIPLVFSFYLSFTDWRGVNLQDAPFVGLGNYDFLRGDRRFWAAMLNSAKYTLMSVPLGMAISLAIAVVMNQKLRGIYIFRTLFFMPVISSWVAVAVIWVTLLDTRSGIINWLLDLVGLGPVPFLQDANTALPTLVLIAIWKGAGFQMVIWLAGLQAIPQELYEAAAIDGGVALAGLLAHHPPAARAHHLLPRGHGRDRVIPGVYAGVRHDEGRAARLDRRGGVPHLPARVPGLRHGVRFGAVLGAVWRDLHRDGAAGVVQPPPGRRDPFLERAGTWNRRWKAT
ncbi:MAG: sugar ABC transporter permease [Anaerolineae bacterium]|nr:sugar ABC transporter permease [Anaerolineae bacterium]